MSAPGLIIAAPGSGHGKTTVTLGLLRALRGLNEAVAAFQVGPDFLGPMRHARATGRESVNLDPWGMRLETLADLADRTTEDSTIVIGEGVMGLFDGAVSERGSTAELASLLDLPVVLVVDASALANSAAAVVEGFIRFRDDVDVAAVIFNRVGSEAHARVLRRAADDRFSQPVVGCLPDDPGCTLPDRGLVQADQVPALEAHLDRLAGLALAHLDLDQLRRIARPFGVGLFGPPAMPLPPLGQRIALARDEAFAFAYPATLEGWRAAGAEISIFSPLADQAPDEAADAVFLPGGCPELHAGRLAANRRSLGGLRAAAERGAFVYGEGGGFIMLGHALIDGEGGRHALADLLPVVASFEDLAPTTGYRRLQLQATAPLGRAGATFRGHMAHAARVVAADACPALFEMADAQARRLGPTGARVGTVAGSFAHLIDRSSEPDDVFAEVLDQSSSGGSPLA